MQQQIYRRAVRTADDAVSQAAADRISDEAHRDAVAETLRRAARRDRAVTATLRKIESEV